MYPNEHMLHPWVWHIDGRRLGTYSDNRQNTKNTKSFNYDVDQLRLDETASRRNRETAQKDKITRVVRKRVSRFNCINERIDTTV